MARQHDIHEPNATESARRGAAGLVAEADQGSDQAAADLRDLALVLARSATDSGRRTSLDEVLDAFGHTRESLATLPDGEYTTADRLRRPLLTSRQLS
jgi:hypothetical protein